ncbi:unnamed protein product, partial [Mesorhabditis spiculigera]
MGYHRVAPGPSAHVNSRKSNSPGSRQILLLRIAGLASEPWLDPSGVFESQISSSFQGKLFIRGLSKLVEIDVSGGDSQKPERVGCGASPERTRDGLASLNRQHDSQNRSQCRG